MKLDLSSLQRAVTALNNSLDSYFRNEKNASLKQSDLDTLKAGVIQNYEVAYELCWKFMKRWIEENVSPAIVDGVPRQELYRVSAENKLITDVEEWMFFHKSRNLTSHTYNANNAEQAFDAAKKFIFAAQAFQKVLEAKND